MVLVKKCDQRTTLEHITCNAYWKEQVYRRKQTLDRLAISLKNLDFVFLKENLRNMLL